MKIFLYLGTRKIHLIFKWKNNKHDTVISKFSSSVSRDLSKVIKVFRKTPVHLEPNPTIL